MIFKNKFRENKYRYISISDQDVQGKHIKKLHVFRISLFLVGHVANIRSVQLIYHINLHDLEYSHFKINEDFLSVRELHRR